MSVRLAPVVSCLAIAFLASAWGHMGKGAMPVGACG